MAMLQPKEFLDKLNTHTEDEQLRIMENILTWADEREMYRRRVEEMKQEAKEQNEEAINLKVEIRMLKAELEKGCGDAALRSEVETLRKELEKSKSEAGNAAGVETMKQQYEAQIKELTDQKQKLEAQVASLTEQLAFQTSRADGLAVNCEQLAANLRAANEKLQQPSELQGECDKLRAELEASKKKIDSHLALNRQLQEQIKVYEKDIKNAGGADKRIRELEEELHKREIELKKQVANAADWQRTAAEWETKCGHLQNIIDTEHAVSAQKRAIRDAKATGGMELPGQAVSMQGVGGPMEMPKQSKSGVNYKYESPAAARGAAVWKQGDGAQRTGSAGQSGELERIKQELAELKQKYEDVVREKGELSVMLNAGGGNADLEEENHNLKAQLEHLKKQTGDLSELDSLKTVNKTQKQQLDKLVKEKEELEANIKKLNDELNRFKSDSADAKTLADEKAKLIEENEKLKAQVKKLEDDIKDLNSKLEENEKELKDYHEEQEKKRKEAEAAREAANSSFEMRMSTQTAEVEKHRDAKYLTTNSGFEGRVRIKANAPRKKAYFVMVENKVFPNPYLFREMTTGKQSYHTLQQLKTLFDIEGLDNENMTYRLLSVTPAVVFVPDGAVQDAAVPDSFDLKEKGKLKVEHQV